ncbi:hypothetical protein ACFQ3L_00415 [Lacticaseibacillus jixianensis]|uniref:Uncharacterized protein n=1 Tax=Lacticaseibacillus jixianensis TaxID=2486012 RepID=A0ABW4B7B5_9LACO|nr:hypothetical protein [Lacticaseibacillus jixianensis]
MAELEKAHRLAINQLLDHAIFTGSIDQGMRQSERKSREVYQSPSGRQRIQGWFSRLFGEAPTGFRDNWLWLMGPEKLPATHVTVLLATLKAVINTPAAQGIEADRVIEARPVIAAVHSAVPELGERKIRKIIDSLFVERFKLLTPDNPEVAEEKNSTVQEYWDVAEDFVSAAQLLVSALKTGLKPNLESATPLQQVNRYLLKHRYLDQTQPQLWATLKANKVAVADMWAPLQRFYLEVGDDYALLLDGARRQLQSRQYFVALAVARSLGAGVPDADLGQRIKMLSRQLYSEAVVNQTQVKEEIENNSLAQEKNGFWIATPVAKRFAITLGDSDGK